MRPIDKGEQPQEFSKYQQAKGYLIVRLGDYCSYCERPLNSAAVEHIQPKSKEPSLERSWDNFLLACINCNSIKSDKEINLYDYYWPDKDNTFLALNYITGGIIITSPNLTDKALERAKNTINLTGLDRIPSDDPSENPEMKDTRWRARRDALQVAERVHKNLRRADTEFARGLIVDLAKATGFFSIWMTVFKEDLDMLKKLIEAFPGTSSDCFDSEGAFPIKRKSRKL